MVPSWPSEELSDHFLCPTSTDLFTCVLSLTITATRVGRGWGGVDLAAAPILQTRKGDEERVNYSQEL